MNPMISILSADDPRIYLFTQIRDRRLAREHQLFVVEGEFLVHRLLKSPHQCKAVLVSESRAHKFSAFRIKEFYVASDKVIQDIVGFKFHRGILALGYIPRQPTLHEWLETETPRRVVVCPEINDPENLGAILRSALALGYQAVLLGPSCCQPFVRRAIRTSMGAIFYLPLITLQNPAKELGLLQEQHNLQTVATLTSDDAVALTDFRVPDRLAIVLGTEAHGLAKDWVELCRYRVCIPMNAQSDSLNVAVAAGVFMYALAQRPS